MKNHKTNVLEVSHVRARLGFFLVMGIIAGRTQAEMVARTTTTSVSSVYLTVPLDGFANDLQEQAFPATRIIVNRVLSPVCRMERLED